MKAMIVAIGAILVTLTFVVGYLIGQSHGSSQEVKQRTKYDLEVHRGLVELDRWFLAGVTARPNTMTSGKYTLEIRWTGAKTEVSTVELEMSDGRLSKVRDPGIHDVMQMGNVVSWERYDVLSVTTPPGTFKGDMSSHEQSDMDEGPSARFVGLIDGDGMWGRVYVEPGQGWHEGEPPMYGVWRLHRQAEK